MSILTKKTTPTVVRIVKGNPYGLMVDGQFELVKLVDGEYEPFNGSAPAELAGVSRAVPYADARNAKRLDVEQFARDIARDRARPSPQAAERLTEEDIFRRLAWTREDFDFASGFGFPKARWTSATSTGRNQTPLYAERDVREWVEAIQRLARRLTKFK